MVNERARAWDKWRTAMPEGGARRGHGAVSGARRLVFSRPRANALRALGERRGDAARASAHHQVVLVVVADAFADVRGGLDRRRPADVHRVR